VKLLGRQATSLAVITNELVSNALKHGNSQTEIHLRVCENNAILEVSDNGPGFPEGFAPHQAANTGIELVENIARWDLRGKTLYASRPEGGGMVTVLFPIAPH
jgi:two-component sensor histidine kinase